MARPRACYFYPRRRKTQPGPGARAGQGVTRETEKQTDEYKSANVKSIFSLRVFE